MDRGSSWLDFKLGLRMLVRYPGLTAVGGLAIAVAIGIGAAYFEFARDLTSSELPLPEGDRIVGIQNWDVETSRTQMRSLHDFATWRAEMTSVRELGAFSLVQRNLITDDGRAEPMTVTEITASGFQVPRVPALLGRTLVEADEAPGAPPVAVIGHDLWLHRFAGDREIVGRTVRLDGTTATVVGVMPKDFAFPMQNHLWVPLQASPSDVPRLQGPSIQVFGRLAPGATLERAQAELTALGLRAASEFPETNEHLRPRIMPYTQLFIPASITWQLYLVGSVFVMFLVVVSANVATLVFARTAMRENEIAVRNALGATRGRIIVQLFTEALMLSVVGALVGLAAAAWGLGRATGVFWEVQGPDSRPFWWNDGLSGATLVYVAALAVFGAVIAGVLPALKATGRKVQSGITRAGGRGSSMRLGGAWTAVIVVQVALTVAFLPSAISEGSEVVRYRAGGVGVPAEQFLSARMEMDSLVPPGAPAVTSAELDARFAAAYREIERRLEGEAGTAAVTFGDRLPGMDHPGRRIEADGLAAPADREGGPEVRTASVDADFFEAMGAPVLSGRAFHGGDVGSGQNVVVVNRSFSEQVLGGRNPVGQRVRYAAAAAGQEPGPWHEIVGVVGDLGMNPTDPGEGAGMYHPVGAQRLAPFRMAVRVTGGTPEALAPRLRAIAAAVDPELRLYDVQRMDEVSRADQVANRLVLFVLVLIAGIALLLSTVGIYSLISFTVSQRTREIGIRIALGADPRRIVTTILSRVFSQLAMGVVVGGAVAVLLLLAGMGDQMAREGPQLLIVVAAAMLVVGLLACLAPARRVLRIHPREALGEG